ncbi:hypothetical protein PFISCL1PPCAC_26215 [Pristionchus fissidentatus]|uniref:Uncharacterized protein n=1 Tax=Pristionchus fissidentatus TaxID=1538716 RepID=A0AAV5W0E4_9BILA|nr:hypothetical protein PFISCL1PPCAC_16858 [Pristionchus fissidentatus]GMT34918.1 hypothetical protein PFISCL1PPCAC_26215 [Pristionchus fissidentatus]
MKLLPSQCRERGKGSELPDHCGIMQGIVMLGSHWALFPPIHSEAVVFSVNCDVRIDPTLNLLFQIVYFSLAKGRFKYRFDEAMEMKEMEPATIERQITVPGEGFGVPTLHDAQLPLHHLRFLHRISVHH